jgi:hypothetical protein
VQVDKSRSDGKKEKEKIHVSNGEWRIIMSTINHETEVPANSKREVLMGSICIASTQKEVEGRKRRVQEKPRK